jgi:acetyl esterase/lipase
MLTRPFFRSLAEKGHVVLDIAYSLYPEADMQTMVSEVNQAILWTKEKGQTYGINPDRIVLMGGSAGAHLSLLAAYTPGQPEFQPTQKEGDTSVRGVVAFYPAVDIREMYVQTQSQLAQPTRPIDNVANAMFDRIFELHPDPSTKQSGQGTEHLPLSAASIKLYKRRGYL